MELLTPSLGLIFWQVLIFGTLFFILRKFAWNGILSALKEREDDISSALRLAEETRAEMAKLKAGNEKLLADARTERDGILKEAKDAANGVIAEAKEKAVAESNRILSDARETMQQERAAMVAKMREDVATLSIEIAEKVLRKELADKKTQQSLVADLMSDAKLN